MRRHSMSRSASRANFTRNAVRHKSINYSTNPMRGGIRL